MPTTDPDLLEYMANERNKHRIEAALFYLRVVEDRYSDPSIVRIVTDLRTMLAGK